ncbi:hypothetical protein EMPS_07682 [Entomortierella parvispora]|uniref:Uncharacterized protein n=1 Tax=Entomortierella parvispora TaxID=205924 RepID=A0A9P3LYK9_9FUNG|nr:hypothetical protein EMPS_07682 [Entomortierella parvispora]
MTNHPKELDIHISGGPPEGLMFSMSPDEDDLMSMIDSMQDITSFGIAGRIWESTYVLNAFLRRPSEQLTFTPQCPIPSEYFLSSTKTSAGAGAVKEQSSTLDPIRIVELGAGTGLVGIALAKRLNPSATLMLTDLEEVIPLLEKNVQDTQDWRLKSHGSAASAAWMPSGPSEPASERPSTSAHLEVEPLAWGNSSHAARILSKGRVDYVLACDLVYFPELYPPLLQTLREITDLDTRVIFGYKDRAHWKEMPFWEQFGRYFEMEVVRIERKKSPGTSDDENEEDEDEQSDIFGYEQDMFIFVAKKRQDKDILAGVDDTLTTLMMMQIRY